MRRSARAVREDLKKRFPKDGKVESLLMAGRFFDPACYQEEWTEEFRQVICFQSSPGIEAQSKCN